MTVRRKAPSLNKTLVALSFLLLSVAVMRALPPIEPSNPSVAATPAAAEPDGELVTRTNLPLSLPDSRVYDRLTAQVLGAEPSTRNGKTGQFAMFVLLFTFLSAVTLVFWRRHRRDYASPRRIGRRI